MTEAERIAEWTSRAQGGGEGAAEAFESLYTTYRKRIYYFCHCLLEDEAAAVDATCSVFLYAWRNLRSLPAGQTFYRWICGNAFYFVKIALAGLRGASVTVEEIEGDPALFDEMVKLMATDKAKHTVLPLTKFGLMQITRQRVRPVAVQEVKDVCPTCRGTGKIEPTVLLDKKIENQISLLTEDRGHRYLKLVVSPYVAAFLRHGLWSLRWRWMMRYKAWIRIIADQSVGIVDVKYRDRKNHDLIN